jgi:outer membrane lipoprotein SlyB
MHNNRLINNIFQLINEIEQQQMTADDIKRYNKKQLWSTLGTIAGTIGGAALGGYVEPGIVNASRLIGSGIGTVAGGSIAGKVADLLMKKKEQPQIANVR